MTERLQQQIAFLVEVDRLKTVLRQTVITDRSRAENTGEHSWHIALMAVVLAEHGPPDLDVLHTVKMLLVHDLVEIDAGDTFGYDEVGYRDKEARERCAADRIFGLLPEDQQHSLRALWDEFEEASTAEARMANAIDRLQPALLNSRTEGHSWVKHDLHRSQVEKRLAPIGEASDALGDVVRSVIEDAVARGWLRS